VTGFSKDGCLRTYWPKHIRQLTARAAAGDAPISAQRWRGDLPVVPVVRLTRCDRLFNSAPAGPFHGRIARTAERAFGSVTPERWRLRSLAGRIGRAVAPQSIGASHAGEEKNCRSFAFVEDVAGLGRLHDRVCGRWIVCDPLPSWDRLA